MFKNWDDIDVMLILFVLGGWIKYKRVSIMFWYVGYYVSIIFVM